MKKICKVILAAAAVAALAVPAMAADKLAVKSGVDNVFSVSDTGVTAVGKPAGTPAATDRLQVHYPNGLVVTDPVSQYYQNGKARVIIKSGGSQSWLFTADGTTDVGKFEYATPGNMPGLIIYTGADAAQNRFNIINNGTFFRMYFNAPATGAALGISATTNYVGVLTNTPTAPLHVNGNTIRLATAKAGTGACNVGDITWDATAINVCVATDTWKKATLQ